MNQTRLGWEAWELDWIRLVFGKEFNYLSSMKNEGGVVVAELPAMKGGD